MRYKVLSVRDTAANAFGRPVFAAAVGAAVRSFSDEVNRVAEGNEMNSHPGDFDLYELGEFDDSDGMFTLLPLPVLLSSGRSVLIGA